MVGPSKYVIFIFVFMVLIVGGIITLSNQPEEAPQNIIEPEIVIDQSEEIAVNRQQSPIEVDTDGDGLPDWQESLRGTDVSNPDTDGDGTNDNEELLLNRNPLVAGPDDSTEIIEELDNPFDVPDFTPGSLTDEVAVNIASNYFEAKQQDAATPEFRSQLIGSIGNNLDTMTVNREAYSYANITTFPAEDTQDKDYANKLSLVQLDNFSKMASIPNIIPETYLGTLSTAYQNFSREFIEVPVPEPLADIHIGIANNLYNFGIVVEELGSYTKDPIRGIMSLKKYSEIIESQPKLYEQLKNYFDNNGIIFTEEDPGYFLTRYAETLEIYADE